MKFKEALLVKVEQQVEENKNHLEAKQKEYHALED